MVKTVCSAGDPGPIPRSGRSSGGGPGNPLQYSCLKNSMDGGAWQAIVHWVTKSWTLSTPPSRAGRDASGTKNGAGRFFSLLQMGANNSSLTPLNFILKNWDRFDPQGLKKTHLVFLCDTAWPQYPLEDGEWWPVGGSLKYNTVLQLDRFCKEQGKWVEVTYVLPFYSL